MENKISKIFVISEKKMFLDGKWILLIFLYFFSFAFSDEEKLDLNIYICALH
jgi:hypothetical protein